MPGTFTYISTSRTILRSCNNQSLSVLFAPGVTGDYTSVTGVVLITNNSGWITTYQNPVVSYQNPVVSASLAITNNAGGAGTIPGTGVGGSLNISDNH